MKDVLKILIAEDNETDRLILSRIISRDGHAVTLAVNGAQAVELYDRGRHDIVLLDALMPVQDGFEAARAIRELAGEELVPIIFLTSLQDVDSLTRCLESGGDDFLSKPYNSLILKAKIKAFGRMRSMHAALRDNHRQLLLEQSVAKNVFDNVTYSGSLAASNIRYSLSPIAMFNGDTVLAQHRPDGGLHVFLGDFTGHGLPAAIGAMPIADTFYGMTSKGFELEEIVREMNNKLCKILPTGIFCCGAAVHIDMAEKTARLWLGGVPDCYLYYASSNQILPFGSSNIPLGITTGRKFTVMTDEFSMQNGDRLFLWSDGIIEAENEAQEMFGEERLRNVFQQAAAPERIYPDLLAAVDDFIGVGERSDDITLVEVTMSDPVVADLEYLDEAAERVPPALDWEVSFIFSTITLKNHNPMPLVMHVLSETEGLKPYISQLYTLIAELYSNALEHGVLQLDSGLKKTGSGFGRYYQERQDRLEQLEKGEVRLLMRQIPLGRGGRITIRVEDSGNGFNHLGRVYDESTDLNYSGRGLNLLRKLCTRVEYLGCGNQVEVDFEWPRRRLGEVGNGQ
ncbi:MAG: fused response regulator/phosphatase [Natronospirillum sp.]